MSAASSEAPFTLGILSGGAGRRLGGADKGLMIVDAMEQVQRVRAAFGAAPAAVLVSANRHLDRYRALGFDVVEDSIPDYPGPLAGIAALLAACRTPWLLSVPVDAVQIPDGIAAHLFEALATAPDSIAIARLRDDDGLQPTVALYPATLTESAAAALQAGERSLQRWQEAQGCTELRLPASIGNRNTPTDYPDTASTPP
ncbi:MAG TPA: NTP transferase domain-containing protein [Xanthomonadaceae bacterium]|nr:NTP transferase domain-containing protein [Xanthomonadaceae bacterium]